MDESLSDTYGYSECSGTPSYNVSCDVPGSCKSPANTIYELDDPYYAIINVCVKLCLRIAKACVPRLDAM